MFFLCCLITGFSISLIFQAPHCVSALTGQSELFLLEDLVLAFTWWLISQEMN